MKIVLAVHCFFPSRYHGTEVYTLDLARHWTDAGHEVTVLSSNFPGDPSPDEMVFRYEYQGIPVICLNRSRLPYTNHTETWLDERVRAPLTEILSELRPDLVHVTHLMNHSAVLLEVVSQLKIPMTATFTDFFGLCLNAKLEAVDGSLCSGPSALRVNCISCQVNTLRARADSPVWIQRAWSPRRVRLASQVGRLIAATPLMQQDTTINTLRDVVRRPSQLSARYNANYRLAVAPTQFLHDAYASNGVRVPMKNMSFGIDVDRAPKPVRGGGHRPVIGFIGQMAVHKGPDLLLQAFSRLAPGQARLQLWGDPDQVPPFGQELRRLATGLDVDFMGVFGRERLAEVMSGIDLLVLPSRWYENSPLVLLGALATHTPVLVADVAGMTEFLEDGVNGLRFARGDVADLERALRELLSEPGRLARMSAQTHYGRTARDMALETLSLVESAL
jgi:glycosyltransferase involved in cell wall biosynthesis